MKCPLLLLASCFALGILAAHRWTGMQNTGFLLAAAGVCLLVGLLLLRVNSLGTSCAFGAAGFVLVGALAFGIFQNRFPPRDIHNLSKWGVDLKSVELEGVVASVPIRTAYGFGFDLDCQGIQSGGRRRAVQGKVQIRLFVPADSRSWNAADALDLHYGDAIRAPVRLRKPTAYQNPGSFDFRWWMEAIRDVSWEGQIQGPLRVQKLSTSQAPELLMLAAQIRARLLRGIDRLYPPWSVAGRAGAVLKAVLLGDRSSLDSDTLEHFRQSGLYHLLVISGLHVGLLAAVVLYFLRLLRMGETWRAALLFLFLVVYALLVEQRAPTLRATLMISAYLLARYFYRDHAALNAVGLAALALLFYRPAWLFEAGFDLSFSAALLIAGVALPILQRTTVPYQGALRALNDVERDSNLPPRLAQFRLDLRALVPHFWIFGRRPKLAEYQVTVPARVAVWTIDLLLFSAILQVGLFMPMAETFHRITLVGIGLNALAVPLMTVLVALAVPTVILSASVPILAALPGKLLLWVTNALLALTEFRMPRWMSYRIPGPPLWVALGFAATLVGMAWAIGRNKRIFWSSGAAFAVFAGLVIVYPFAPRIPKGGLEVTALDCGRGEAIFTALPDGTTLLMDAGGRERFGPDLGRWNPGEGVVSPYLWSRGIQRIDIVVLSDASFENIKAMDAIIHNFRVGQLWRGPRVTSPAYTGLVEAARHRGVAIREATSGVRQRRGGSDVEILWPPRVLQNNDLPKRDDAPVLRVAQAVGSVLLAGNADKQVMRALAESPTALGSEVLQSSRPLSQVLRRAGFLAKVNPEIVVISGARSDKRAEGTLLPLMAFHSRSVRVFGTAKDGAVTVDIGKSPLGVRPYREPQSPEISAGSEEFRAR